MLTANVVTLFPEIFPGPLGISVIGNGLNNNYWKLNLTNLRDFAIGKHKTIDDKPYGGGVGMLMRPDVIGNAIEDIKRKNENTHIIFPTPKGRLFDQKIAQEIVGKKNITIICGRFEGIDERAIEYYNMDQISIGNYILAGGELAAIVIIESCVRLIKGVLGNEQSLKEESFTSDYKMEYPQYTKPATWNGLEVPEILRSGHHKKIKEWRQEKSNDISNEACYHGQGCILGNKEND